MIKTYIQGFSDETRWEVVKLMLYKGQYDQIEQMVAEGYPLTDRLLESLYRLGQKDVIDKLLEVSVEIDSSTYDFLREILGIADLQELKNEILTRKKEELAYVREEKRQKQEAEKKHLEQAFEKELKSGLGLKLMELAHQNDCWQKVIEKFGAEAVYAAVQDKEQYLADVRRALPCEFLYERGDFSMLWFNCSFNVRASLKENSNWINGILNYHGGAEALYELQDKYVDGELVRLGYKKFFFNDVQNGCRRLAKVKALTIDDLKNLYQNNPQAVKRFIRHHGTFKQKAALFLGMFRK